MVYIYYMKNNILRLAIFVSFVFFSAFLNAKTVTVVRVTDNKIYLDTSSLSRPVQKDDLFKVILSAEKLVNPKTGKDLGDVYTYSPAGKIVEVGSHKELTALRGAYYKLVKNQLELGN